MQVWNGSEGALGYFCYLAQQRAPVYGRMLGILLGSQHARDGATRR